MSRPGRRPTTHSRGNSSHGPRSLSVTEALQSIRLTETVGEHPVGLPSSYSTSHRRGRPSHRDETSAYEQSHHESSPYSSSTLDPSVLDPYSRYDQPSYSDQPTSTTSSYLSTSASMSNYPSYSQPPLSSPYSASLTSRPPSQYGKLTNLMASDSASRRRLNGVGYPNPSTGASMSSSMSGPSLPSIPPRTYEEVRSVGREFVERRRRTVHRPRRERKIILRQAILPSTPSVSQAEDMSGAIDSFLAHSTSSYGSNSPYAVSSSHPAYGSSTTRSSYDPSYTAGYDGGGSSQYTTHGTSRAYPIATAPGYEPHGSRRPSGQGTADPVVLETPSRPQCWDHGCNGRQFSTFSNLLRHQREKSGSSTKSVCHRCGAEFTRKTARDGHLAQDKCRKKSPGR